MVSPRLVGGAGARALAGDLARPVATDVDQLLEEDGFLFFRLTLPRGRPKR